MIYLIATLSALMSPNKFQLQNEMEAGQEFQFKFYREIKNINFKSYKEYVQSVV